MSAHEQAILCTAAQIAGDLANPGSRGNSADVEIGRRNIEGGGQTSVFEHNNIRVVIGSQGDVIDNWTYDVYGSYYYVMTFQIVSSLDISGNSGPPNGCPAYDYLGRQIFVAFTAKL